MKALRQSGSDMEPETDERADEEHAVEVPSARPFRSRRPPVWMADYDTEY